MTARVTPASSRSREARPGLSRGIKLPGKRRGGAPRGERAPMSPPPPPFGAAHGWWGPPRARLPFVGRLFEVAFARTRARVRRENASLFALPCRGRAALRKERRVGK